MKVEERVLDVDSTLEGEKIRMMIDPGAFAHIAKIMIDLYSDQELAVLREYSTNALDAHVEAGVTRPIEVTLPTSLAPFVRIRDYGFGLDDEDIREIYSRYGASTKRETNDAVGMLGLGSKSALTYTDQFTVTGIKNGICTQVSVSRSADGGGDMTIVDQYETDDPSGVEIIVPAKNYNHFERKAKDFFRFWNEGTVLVNGEAPKRIDGMWISDDIVLTTETDKCYIVMGNVAYPFNPNNYARYNCVAFVNIGDVHFVPSREALQMTATTQATIKNIQSRVAKESEAAFERIIQEAPNKVEALEAALKADFMGYKGKAMYKGVEIPKTAEVKSPDVFVMVKGNKYYRERASQTVRTIYASNWKKNYWITGYTSDTFSGYRREKLLQWAEKKGVNLDNSFVFCKTLPHPDWIDPSTVFTWAEIDAEKIIREKKQRQDGRPSGSYEAHVDGYSKTISAADIDTSKPIIYAVQNVDNVGRGNVVKHLNPDGYTLIILSNNRVAKFERDFPMAQRQHAYLREAANKWWKSLSPNKKLAVKIQNSGNASDLARLDHTRIDDPELRKVVRIASDRDVKLMADYDKLGPWIGSDAKVALWVNPADAYPLLTGASYRGTITKSIKDHIYIYINAVYAQREEGN